MTVRVLPVEDDAMISEALSLPVADQGSTWLGPRPA
jgi:hypothetical protein